jgi:hypothetical protein
MPAPLKDQLIKNRINKLTTWADDYDNSIAKADLDKAKLDRNEIIYQSLQLIDENYNQFENDLFVGRASSNVLMDITELGVAAATGITNGERVKTILAIALTAFKGGRKSVDVNFFRERSTEIVALKMRAARAKILQTIHQGLGLPVVDYPLGAALDDLINYLYAGSINSALLELAQDTGADAKVAREQASELKIHPFLTKAQALTLASTREAIIKIRERLQQDTTRPATEVKLRAALAKLDYAAAEIQAAQTWQALLQLVQDRLTDATRNRNTDMLNRIQVALNEVLNSP